MFPLTCLPFASSEKWQLHNAKWKDKKSRLELKRFFIGLSKNDIWGLNFEPRAKIIFVVKMFEIIVSKC